MKKLFTTIAVCMAVFTAFNVTAGSALQASAQAGQRAKVNLSAIHNSNSTLRSSSCDTLTNLNFASADTVGSYFNWSSPSVGYAEGNGALSSGGNFLTITTVGEGFTAPSAGMHVTYATAFFALVKLKATAADSALVVTAYVYDTAATSLFNQVSPGSPIDSATSTTGFIAVNGGAAFNFTHQAAIPGKHFFIMIKLPQVAGDTIVLVSNNGTTGRGNAWLGVTQGFASIDSITGGNLTIGNYIFAGVCASSCPNITATATKVTSTSADVTASGGVAPYTYSWSSSATTDTATGLTPGSTYTVTVTDHNGCTGTATITLPLGIAQLSAGVANFSVYPNPSNGMFNASLSLETVTDVTITVMDMAGQKMFESTDKAVKDLNKAINLGGLSAGIYVVNVKTESGSVNQRIVIK